MEKEETPSGILIGGTDSGSIMMWNPLNIINGETDDALIVQTEKHTGKPSFILCHEITRVLCMPFWMGLIFS